METEKRVFKTDAFGNELYVEGKFIWLGMSGKPQERIGYFDLDNKRIVMNYEDYQNHYSQRFRSYGFNEAVLLAAKKCDTVYLICPEGRFNIPIKIITKYGTPLIYKVHDLSNQLYIELSLIKNYVAV